MRPLADMQGPQFDHRAIVIYGNRMSRKKISTTVYITPEQDERLKELHERTKVPVAEYIRQGIDLILRKYEDQLPGQRSLFDVGK
jgi:hypothetical protein